MNRFTDLITGRPRAILLGVLIATLYLAAGLAKLETRNNQESELPADDPIVLTNERLKSVFGDKAVILIGLETEDVYNTETLSKVAEISEALRQVEGVIDDEILSLSTVDNIRGEEWGLDVGPLFDEVPATSEEVARLRSAVLDNDLLNGQLVSEDGTLTLIQANVEDGYNQVTVHAAVSELVAKYRGPEKIHLAGDAIQAQEIDRGIQLDVSRLLPLVLLLTLAGFFISFRSWRGVWFPFSVTVLSVVWTMGLMGHLGIPLTVVSSALPILMVAISSSYGIHVLHHYYEGIEATSRERARACLQRVAPAIGLTGIISAIGSASLITFRVTSIREFGIVTALGVLATMVVSLTFAPALLSLLKPGSHRSAESHWLDPALVAMGRFAVRRSRAILAVTAAVFAVSAVGISRLEIGTDFVKYFPADHPLRTSFETFDEHLGGARRMDVMVVGAGEDAIKDPALLRRIAAFQDYAESFDEVGRTYSFADVVARIHQEMNGGDPAFHTIPESSDLIAQYLLLYSMSADAGDFGNLVDYDFRSAKIQVMLTTSEQRDHRMLYEAFQRYGDENLTAGATLDFGGDVMFWLAQIHYIAVGKVFNILTGIGTVLLFCSLIFRSLPAGVLTIVPLVVSTALTFGIMGFVGIRLETGTAIITSIAVGIGVDFALHYLMYFREEARRWTGPVDVEVATVRVFRTVGQALTFNEISSILGFSVLAFSGFMPIRYFAYLVSLTMVTTGIGTLLLMPAIIAVWKPAFLLGPSSSSVHSLPKPATVMPSTSSAIGLFLLVVSAAFMSTTDLSAQSLNGRQIMERNDAMQRVSDEQVSFRMTLVNDRGQKREREVSWIRRDQSGNQSVLIRFAAPADVRGTGLLSIENPEGDDDQWLYLPALERSRRISAANRSDSFVGSDFAYEDLSAEEMDQYRYELLREEAVAGVPMYVVEAVPTAERASESGYSRRRIWVRKDNFAAARVEFYDRRNELVKVFVASDIRRVPGSTTWRAHTMEMRNQKTGHSTVLTFATFAIDAGVGSDAFTTRALERGR